MSESPPIVLVHGILGFNQLTLGGARLAEYFRNVPDALRAAGHDVAEPPRLNPAGSVAERAADLRNYLLTHSEVTGKGVHVIAHSMGGLDTRFMIAKLGMADRVRSLTTIGTPHHGSPIADIVVKGTNPVLNKFIEHLGVDIKGVLDLTTSAAQKFNSEVADDPAVRYFSVAGEFEPPKIVGVPQGLLGVTHEIIEKAEGKNDGLVSVSSTEMPGRSAWTHLGTWPANHYRLLNWGENLAPTPLELADDGIAKRYLTLAEQLAQTA